MKSCGVVTSIHTSSTDSCVSTRRGQHRYILLRVEGPTVRNSDVQQASWRLPSRELQPSSSSSACAASPSTCSALRPLSANSLDVPWKHPPFVADPRCCNKCTCKVRLTKSLLKRPHKSPACRTVDQERLCPKIKFLRILPLN